MDRWAEDIRDWARARGYALAFGSPDAVRDVKTEIESRRVRGDLAPHFYRRSLSSFRYLDDAEMADLGTVIVLAVPRAAHRLTFSLPTGPFQAVMPPTYRSYRALFTAVHDDLTTGPLPSGVRLMALGAPLKNVAARLGLVTYGRNNVTYLAGGGSYHQLVGFVVDAPHPGLPGGDSRPRNRESGAAGAAASPGVAMSPACMDCRACVKACPTGAISGDRFLLHAERCLTFINENPGDWPEWVPSSAHKCLVGCLTCQQVCPPNKGRLKFVDLEPAFTEEETAAILEDGSTPAARRRRVWKAVKVKLAELGFPGHEDSLTRNLTACLAAARRAPASLANR